MNNKIDLSSTAVEKGLDIAKEFVDKLIMPAAEEVGLLVKDRISLWRIKNQVQVINKAKSYCDKHGIQPKQVSPKLLVPFLEGAALEDDEVLQDKWAVLLSNLLDSEQNIENHVFPHVLSQIGKEEYLVLEHVYQERRDRRARIRSELKTHQSELPDKQGKLQKSITSLEEKIELLRDEGTRPLENNLWSLYREKRDLEIELSALQGKGRSLQYRMNIPEIIPEDSLKE